MATELTRLLGISYPIIQGGMAWVSDGHLAAAVSQAGGAGVIAGGGRDAAWVRSQIRQAKQETDKPFGVNIALMAANKEELVEVVCAEKVHFVTMGAGNPIPYFAKLSAAGIKKIPVVPNARLALRVEEQGADALIIEGMESGGHIGQLTTMALMTQVIPLLHLPVIAAGGFADGRGVAAALLMGAAGVQMGTRFLLAEECAVHDKVKEKLLAAVDTDTTVTGQLSGHAVRGLKNSFTEKYQQLERSGASQTLLEELAVGTSRKAAVDGDVDNGMVQAGQSLLSLKEIQSAGEILADMIKETRAALRAAGQIEI